jgi:(2S)-methylsuccinyl-CoA dehydrogenase
MALASRRSDAADNLIARAREAVTVVEALLAAATFRVRERVTAEGSIMPRLLDREQRATHGLAWFATFPAPPSRPASRLRWKR